jgi:hypothetical protein
MINQISQKLDYQRAQCSSPALCLIIKEFDNQVHEPNNQINKYTKRSLICVLAVYRVPLIYVCVPVRCALMSQDLREIPGTTLGYVHSLGYPRSFVKLYSS